jgi:uncharacterized protein (DUF2141 family)|tara:strand:+ start:1084 stop:1344 length:261 start_codon:yes stop_codon:yes gene_type:complete
MILDTKDQIAMARVLTLRQGLKLEVRGMRRSRGRTCYSIVKEEFGFKGSKQKVLDQLNEMLEEVNDGGTLFGTPTKNILQSRIGGE